ncbi:MAG: hypothetical protein BWY89_01727 [Bacteroidetes bacterium ADurb.BinA012]|jgi:hypothetical protein|nr:MAG: hypothetical protein BWY89_01727 [Bacteroidetes bacterium ADurb.BinA012]
MILVMLYHDLPNSLVRLNNLNRLADSCEKTCRYLFGKLFARYHDQISALRRLIELSKNILAIFSK